MIGGVVIDVAHRGDRVRLWCADRVYDAEGERCGIGDECGVYVAASGDVPGVGDDVWWGGGVVYWTPADRQFVDRPLRKVGYSSSGSEMLTGLREWEDVETQREDLERKLRLQARALVVAVGALVEVDIARAAGHPSGTQADLAFRMRSIAKAALADLRAMGI